MNRHPPAPRRAAGFTLIEIIISMVLLGILAVLGSSMIYDNVQTGVRVNKAQDTADQGRNALARIARELREISYNTATGQATTGQYLVYSALTGTQTSLIFRRDIPNSTNTAFTTTYVALCYYPGTSGATGSVSLAYSATQPTCGTTAPSSVLSTRVTNFALVFVDNNNALSTATGVTVTTSTLRAIDVTLETTDNSGNTPSGEVMNQKIRVALRNT